MSPTQTDELLHLLNRFVNAHERLANAVERLATTDRGGEVIGAPSNDWRLPPRKG